ncbi:MAG: hypothetical protein WCQ54_09145 [Clostridiaceae bacterium]
MEIMKMNEVRSDVSFKVSKIFVEVFYQWLKFFSKDQKKLTKTFAHIFNPDVFYVAMIDEKVAGFAACARPENPSVHLVQKEFRQHLGFWKGTLAYRILKKEFEDKPYPEKYVSIQQWYKTEGSSPFYTSIFDKEITDYYSWIIQKDGFLLIGTAVPINEDANLKFNLLIVKLKKKGFDIGEFYKKTGTLIMRTRKLKEISLADGNIALIGEAAGLISPSSAEGISYALKSAVFLAESINRNYKEFKSDYVKAARKIKINIFIKNLKIPFMYNSLLRKLVMKSKIFSMDIKKSKNNY